MMDLTKKILGAPNFRYGEFIKSNTAIRLGISNIPTEIAWRNIEELASNVLQPIRDKFGPIKITSGYRSPELNTVIGGSSNSNHCRGEAGDIEPVNGDIRLIDVLIFIYDNLEFRTLIAEFFPLGWIHVDYRKGGNLKRLKLKDKNHDYENVTLEYLIKIC